jgi:hypothetical protein
VTGSINMRRLALTGALAIVVAACGGAAASSAPAGTAGASAAPASQQAPASQDAPASQATGGTGSAISALADLSSYKLKMVLASKGTTSGLGAMGDITMEGTVVLKPEKASDITMMGMRIVEVGGKSYVDLGTGTLTESTDSSQSSLADSLSPEKLLGGMSSYMSGMKSVGDEQKNGIAATHYQADEATLAAASASLSMMGLVEAKWSWDVWVAKEGGYAVGYILKGTGKDGASFSMSIDISDVNSPSNVVKGP